MNIVRVMAVAGAVVLGTSAAYAATPAYQTRYHAPQLQEGRSAYVPQRPSAWTGEPTGYAQERMHQVPEPEYFRQANPHLGTGVSSDETR